MSDGKPTYLVFDTETTGLFDFKLPADAPGQPRLASVAFIVADELGREISRNKHYIKPDEWEMSPETGAINGLTTEFLAENGVPVSAVLDEYVDHVAFGLIVAAFNVQFDAKMMRAELRRASRDDRFETTPNTCIMRSLKPYGAEGLVIKNGQYVKLEAACAHFGILNADAHDAMADAEAARAILEILIRDGRLIPPAVHYAKAKT